MRTIKLTINYDGANYVGWQIQPNGVSIQSLIQKAIRKMTGEKTNLIGASRTDAGVHALGQVAHFDTNTKISCDGFRMGLNSILPDDISIVGVEEKKEGFHSRRDSKSKKYVYRILVTRERRPLLKNHVWRMKEMPDVKKMKSAAKYFLGEKDFSSFRASGCSSKHAIRRIDKIKIELKKVPPELLVGEGMLIDLTFVGTSFLRHMVRNVVGTLVDVGLGNLEVKDIKKIIEAKNRKKAGRAAPACGLYLVEVKYS